MHFLRTLGTLIQVLGVLVALGGVAAGFYLPNLLETRASVAAFMNGLPYTAPDTTGLTVAIIAGCLIVALLMLALGGLCEAQARTVEALEALAQRRRERQ